MGLISALKFDLLHPQGRALLVQGLLCNFPGELGFELRRWVLARQFRRAGPGLRVFPGARLFGLQELSVGTNCWIGLDNIIQANGGIEMGDNVLLGPGVKIWSVNHVSADPDRPIIEQGYDHKRVVIGSNVWVGANTFIMPGTSIPDGTVIVAGSVVGAKDYEPYAILSGNPARKIGSRRPTVDAAQPVIPQG